MTLMNAVELQRCWLYSILHGWERGGTNGVQMKGQDATMEWREESVVTEYEQSCIMSYTNPFLSSSVEPTEGHFTMTSAIKQ